MFDFLARLSSTFSISSTRSIGPMSEPSCDAFRSLLLPDLCTSTDAFLSVYREGISRSTNPVDALTRFQVGPMAVNKEKLKLLEHELMSFKVDDAQSNGDYGNALEMRVTTSACNLSYCSATSPNTFPAVLSGAGIYSCTIDNAERLLGQGKPLWPIWIFTPTCHSAPCW